jgi:hypothetical protein
VVFVGSEIRLCPIQSRVLSVDMLDGCDAHQ